MLLRRGTMTEAIEYESSFIGARMIVCSSQKSPNFRVALRMARRIMKLSPTSRSRFEDGLRQRKNLAVRFRPPTEESRESKFG